MPPNRAPPQRSFNTGLLEPKALVTPGGLQTALGSIERVCYLDDSSITEVIAGLSNRPHTLEYIFSSTLYIPVVCMSLRKQIVSVALDNQAYERLSKWIIAQFPTPVTLNVMDDLGVKLLQRLSSSLMPVEGVSTAERRNELREFRRKVGLSLNVLKELGGWTDRTPAGSNAPAIGRKRPKALVRHAQLDPHPFDCMGIEVPMTEDEVHAVCGGVLPQLQNILEVRIPSPSSLARKTYPVSALPTRPEATSRIGCVQRSTRRPRGCNGVPRVNNPANQGRLVLRKRGGVRRVAHFAIN